MHLFQVESSWYKYVDDICKIHPSSNLKKYFRNYTPSSKMSYASKTIVTRVWLMTAKRIQGNWNVSRYLTNTTCEFTIWWLLPVTLTERYTASFRMYVSPYALNYKDCCGANHLIAIYTIVNTIYALILVYIWHLKKDRILFLHLEPPTMNMRNNSILHNVSGRISQIPLTITC